MGESLARCLKPPAKTEHLSQWAESMPVWGCGRAAALCDITMGRVFFFYRGTCCNHSGGTNEGQTFLLSAGLTASVVFIT